MITEPNVTNAGHVVDTQWSRLTLQYKDEPLVASCRLCQIFSSPNVKVCVAQRCFPELSVRYDLSKAKAETLFRGLVHIDLNRFTRAQTVEGFYKSQDCRPKVIALQVSSDRVADGHEIVGDNWIWLSMGNSRGEYLAEGWLDQFMDLDWQSATRIAKAPRDERGSLYDLEEKFGKLLDITHPGRIENQMAYRLLRDAKAFCGSAPSAPFAETGLTIHAPKTLLDWWKPFDSEGGGDEAKAIRALALCVVDEGVHGDSSKWNAVKTSLINNAGNLKSSVAAFLEVPEQTAANV